MTVRLTSNTAGSFFGEAWGINAQADATAGFLDACKVAGPGGTVTLPAHAIVRLATGTVVPAGVTVESDGTATIIPNDPANVSSLLTLAAGAKLNRVTIDAGTAALYHLLIAVDGCSVTACTFVNGASAGIHVSNANDLSIEGCSFLGVPSYAVLAEGACSRTRIDGNRIRNTTAGQGVTVKTVSGSPTETSVSRNIVDVQGVIGLEIQVAGSLRGIINDNIIRNASIGISLSSATAITVTGNTCHNNSTYGIEAAQAAVDSTIAGNTITSAGTGICATSPTSTPSSQGLIISSNTIVSPSSYGIQIEYGSGHLISGNNISNPGSRGIFLNNAPSGCTVAGNKVRRDTGTGDGIFLTGANHHVSGNTVDYSDLGAQASYGINSNGATELHLLGNYVVGTKKAYVVVAGANVTLVGNRSIGTTEHGVFTSGGTTGLVVDAHSVLTAGGSLIDLSGAVSPKLGSLFNGTRLSNGFEQHNTSILGFYGATPVSRTTVSGSATDAATTQALVNDLRAAMVALGLVT